MYPTVRDNLRNAQQEIETITKSVQNKKKLQDAEKSDIRHALGFINNDIWRLKAAINELEAALDHQTN